jgi:hypothetical protein
MDTEKDISSFLKELSPLESSKEITSLKLLVSLLKLKAMEL